MFWLAQIRNFAYELVLVSRLCVDVEPRPKLNTSSLILMELIIKNKEPNKLHNFDERARNLQKW